MIILRRIENLLGCALHHRLHERKKLEIELKGSLSIIRDFKLLDISQSGAQIEASENLKLNSEYRMNFRNHNSDTISLNVRVVRSELVGSIKDEKGKCCPTYNIGLIFIEPDTEELKKLSSFICESEHQ